MRRWVILAAFLATMPAHSQTLAIIHARAWTMLRPEPVDDATIIFANGHIQSVAPHGAAPAGARIIDAENHIVTPGLVNGATQLGLSEVMEVSDTNDQSVSTGPLGPAFDISYAINANSLQFPVALADGLTRATIFPGGAATAPFSGLGATVRLTGASDLIERRKAAMFAAIGDSTLAKAGGSRAAQWGLLRNALNEARAYTSPRGGGLRDQLLDHPDILALRPVILGQIPLAIQIDRESDIREAIRTAREEKIRVVIIGGAEAWRAAADLASAHIPVILDPEANLPQTFDALGARADNAAILSKAGVPIAFSVSGNGIYLSYDAGLGLREGAGLAVANGLPYADAMRALTVEAAAIWGWPTGTGTFSSGADADLVVWDGDPLEPASAPIAVFVGGKQASLATRQTELRDRYAPAHAQDTLPPGYR